MATFFGNLFILILLICFTSIFIGPLSRPAPGGDAVVGYAFTVIFTGLIMAIATIGIVVMTHLNKGYEWTQLIGSQMFMALVGMTICILAGILTPLMVRFEYKSMPEWLHTVSQTIFIIVTLGFIIAHINFLNPSLREAIPQVFIQKSFYGVVGLGGLVFLFALFIYMRSSAENQRRIIESELAFNDSNKQNHLNEIDSCDVSKNMVFILVFTTKHQDKDVRERALAKIKSYPAWEQELINRLNSGWAGEVFHFLSSNDVDHPEQFLEPINTGILNQAKSFRETIRRSSHPSHFYPGLFSWDVERILETLERYKQYPYDYKPAMLELKSALHEPTEVAEPVFSCEKKIDQWLRNHK